MELLHSTYSITFVMSLKPNQLASFLFKAEEKKVKDTVWDIWLVKYQHMTEEDYISFDDFYKEATAPPEEEIRDMPAKDYVKESFSYIKDKIKKVA